MVASRWPLRFSPAAEISRLTSASVRYSRERTSALRRRFGGPALSTVPLTVVGATSARCDFSMVFQAFLCDCPINKPSWDTAQGKETPILWAQLRFRAAAEPTSTQETLNWRAVSVGGHNRRHRSDGRGQKCAGTVSDGGLLFRRQSLGTFDGAGDFLFSVRTWRAPLRDSPSRSLASMRMNVPASARGRAPEGSWPHSGHVGDAWRPRSVYLLAVYLLETPRNYPPSFLDSLYLLRGSKQ